ncbi:hypothetical protein LOAG_08616 [Loa loa]|uniref:Uncharacterized protein n=1 Tax=Loa loa TaxID=7209 RepID=A0A1S0TUX4_LOALO|nr:hypothetical protein LOAG_08616 [Loa loa]EFO19878.1 hypothetical protein LOAG_08616 [Loa loa]
MHKLIRSENRKEKKPQAKSKHTKHTTPHPFPEKDSTTTNKKRLIPSHSSYIQPVLYALCSSLFHRFFYTLNLLSHKLYKVHVLLAPTKRIENAEEIESRYHVQPVLLRERGRNRVPLPCLSDTFKRTREK